MQERIGLNGGLVGAGVAVMERVFLLFVVGGAGAVARLVAMAAGGGFPGGGASHGGGKTSDIFGDGWGKFIREYEGRLEFSSGYERLLAYSLISVMRADGKISLFEVGALHAIVQLYREIVKRPISGDELVLKIKALIEEISGRESGELIADAMPMSEYGRNFLIECALHVAQWDGVHPKERMFIQLLADRIGAELSVDMFGKAHQAGLEMTEQLRELYPELRDN